MLVAPSSPPPQPVNNSPIAMPNVIVHPPEEEDTPAWCLYDAAQPGRSHSYHPHAHYNHHHHQYQHHNAPPYSYSTDDASPEYSQEHFNNEMYQPTASVVMMQSGSPHGNTHDHQRSFVDLLENNDGGEPFDSDSEYGDHVDDDAETLEDPYHQQAQQQSSSRMRDAANDSDVIEVVKVSRRSKNMDGQQQQQTMPVQRGATLKSRASKVFRSLLRSKPSKTPVPDVPPLPAAAAPAPSARPRSRTSTRRERERQGNVNSNNNNDVPNPSTLSRSNTPTMSRKGSRVLSQLFSAPSIKPRQSISSFDQPEPPSPTQSSSAQNPEPTPVPTPIASPPVVASRPSYSSLGKSSLRSSVYHESQPPPHESRSTHRESLYEPSDALDQARLNASSPTPTTASTASKATRRFSKLNLARLFTFSGPSSSSGGTSNSNSTPAVEDASAVAFASASSHTPLSPVEPPAMARLSKESAYEQEAIDSGRTTPTSRTASQTSPSAASSVSTSTETTAKTEATSVSGSSSASDLTSGPQTPITSELPDLGIVKVVNPPSSITSSPPSIYSVDSYGSRETEPVVPMHNFDSLFETDKSLSLNLGLGIDLGGGSGESNAIGKGKPSRGTTSKRRISSAGTFGSFITGKRGSRVFSAPGGMMRGHSKQSMDKMQEEEKEDELEMKLDSLHFDDLSFDAERFRAEL